jgi:hypothetical protein
MRSREFLKEATIFGRPDRYSFGHKVKVGTSAKGKALLAAIQQTVPTFDPSEELEWIDGKVTRGTPVVQFGSGDTPRLFRRADNTKIAIVGADSAIQGGLLHASGQKGSTEGNVGDLSEPVLSAAVVAKLIKRGANNVDDITAEDVMAALNSAINSGTSSYTVADKNSKIADVIKFTVAVREPTRVFMQRPDFWQQYGSMLPSAVHYANSGQIDRYADHFYKNGKVDMVTIASDGMSDQKGKKTDIEAFANGKPLKNLKISLKAGSSQFGQQGAGSLTADVSSTKGVWQSTVNFFGPIGVEIAQPRKVADKVTFWTKAYKDAYKQLKNQLSGNDARSESGVVAKIAAMVVNHATKGDESVRLVQLSKSGVSTVHSFKNLTNKLLADNINLTASYREGISKNGEPRPELNIYDVTSGKSLIKLGYHATGDNKKIWNSVTMETLLSELTTMVRPTPQPAPQPAPVPTPQPAPVPAGIQNQNKQIGNKIPMGAPPPVA